MTFLLIANTLCSLLLSVFRLVLYIASFRMLMVAGNLDWGNHTNLKITPNSHLVKFEPFLQRVKIKLICLSIWSN